MKSSIADEDCVARVGGDPAVKRAQLRKIRAAAESQRWQSADVVGEISIDNFGGELEWERCGGEASHDTGYELGSGVYADHAVERDAFIAVCAVDDGHMEEVAL